MGPHTRLRWGVGRVAGPWIVVVLWIRVSDWVTISRPRRLDLDGLALTLMRKVSVVTGPVYSPLLEMARVQSL